MSQPEKWGQDCKCAVARWLGILMFRLYSLYGCFPYVIIVLTGLPVKDATILRIYTCMYIKSIKIEHVDI